MDDGIGTSPGSDRIRSPAVAGQLYPADADALGRDVRRLLSTAAAAREDEAPKALIVPHGALEYSGPVAARAFRALLPASRTIRRVVLVGPSHRQHLDGVVLPEAEAFATPLGRVAVDEAGIARLLSLPGVRRSDLPHRREHSLEMQLPFLQVVLHDFAVVPMLVGIATAPAVAAVLERIWGGPETLLVVTSDLSAHRPYRDARALDARTAGRIERFEPALDSGGACGAHLIDGLLAVARRRGLEARTLELANSGDHGGDAARVVGYGAFGFYEPAPVEPATALPDPASRGRAREGAPA